MDSRCGVDVFCFPDTQAFVLSTPGVQLQLGSVPRRQSHRKDISKSLLFRNVVRPAIDPGRLVGCHHQLDHQRDMQIRSAIEKGGVE